MPRLEIALLGSPQIRLNNKMVKRLSAKGQALLFYLVVTRQQYAREHLAELLWSEETMPLERKLNNLRGSGALMSLNREIGDFLIVQRHSLAFKTESDYWLDVDEFEACLRQPNPTVAQLQTAVNLYRNDFLTGLILRDADDFEAWTQANRERLRRLALNALYLLAAHYKAQRQYAAGIESITRLLSLEPYFEEAHRELMLLLALTGQVSAACAHYEKYWDTLDAEGLEPEPATKTLYQELLRGDVPQDTQPPLPALVTPVQAPPFQAPPLVRHFVGRHQLIERIVAQLTTAESSRIHALVGMGGIGKSTLAAVIAHAVQEHFSDGILWANVATSEPTAVLESWAQAYGYDFSRLADVESLANAFRGVLAEKRVLLVLDDVTSASRLRPLLLTSPHSRVLFTTRDQDLAYALESKLWQLVELSPENGRLLLARLLGEERIQAEPAAATDICDLLQNLPLAVEIIGQRLRSRPGRRLADVAQRLRNEKQRLSELKISDREVRASFALSHDTLDASERRVFALMGVFNGRPFTATALAALAAQDHYAVEDRIFALVALSLVQEEGGMRYKQHPLLADFAREKLVAEDEGEIYGRFAHYYLTFAQQHQRDYDVLRPEWDNVMAAMQAAHDHELWQAVIDFADGLHNAWFARARYTEARQGYEWALTAVTQSSQNYHAQARYLRQWGLACLEQRQFDEATDYLSQSIQLCEALNDLAGIAQNQCDLARIALEQSNYDLAEQLLLASRTLRETLGDLPGVAETLHVEARMCYFRGRHEETVRLGKQALAILAKTVHEERTIRTLSLLASASFMQEDLGSAESYAQRALQLSEKVQDKGDYAVILSVLSYIAYRQNNLDTAQTYGEKSLELLKTVGDLGSQAMVLYQLGRIYHGKKQYDLALQAGLQSLGLCQQSHFRLQMGWTLTHVAECYESLGQKAQAQTKWREAQEVAHALQHPALIKQVNKRFN